MRDTSYKVQIFLEESDNGNVKDSTCQCPMGEFKCHHVAATLLFGYKKASKTDIKCSWIKHPKSAPSKRTVTIQELYPSNQPNYTLHWILSKEPGVEALPVPVVEDLLMCQDYLQAEEPLTWLRQQLIVSPEKVIQTAFQTTGQRENAVWAAIGKLRFTASNFGKIIAAAKRNRLTDNLEKRDPIQWGITHESVALTEYCK